MTRPGWIGVDLDGTLAEYDHVWRGPNHIGAPVPLMVRRVKRWLGQGEDVRIFTARVYWRNPREFISAWRARRAIRCWCLRHIGRVLPVTCTKDYRLYKFWDDRAVQIVENTGRRADGG